MKDFQSVIEYLDTLKPPPPPVIAPEEEDDSDWDMPYNEPFKELLGQTVYAIALNYESDDDAWTDTSDRRIVFITDGGPYAYETEGDCCSTTWFADIINIKALIGHTIRQVKPISMPSPKDKRTRSEIDTQYGVELHTDAGVTTVVYRNSSNGYYGGWCSLSKDTNLANCRLITEDHSS